jgi:hypothetical protein
MNTVTNESVNHKLDEVQNKINTAISSTLSDGKEINMAIYNNHNNNGENFPAFGSTEFIIDYSKGNVFSIPTNIPITRNYHLIILLPSSGTNNCNVLCDIKSHGS